MDLSTSRLATVNQSSPVVHGLTDSNFGRSLLLNFENYYEIQIVDGFSSAKKTLGSCATMSFIDSTKGLGWELSFTPYSFNSFCALDSSIHCPSSFCCCYCLSSTDHHRILFSFIILPWPLLLLPNTRNAQNATRRTFPCGGCK